MKNSPRRALSTLLAAALLLGSVPQGAQAQSVRIVSGQTGSMPVSPVGAGGVNAAVMAPALNLGSANLATSFAPIIAPSLIGGSVQAAAAQPVNGAVAVPTALAASPLAAAASGDAPKLPDAPKAATPAAKTTWTARIAAMLGRKPATEKPAVEGAAPSAEAAKTNADKTFDGTAEKSGETAGPVAGAENASRFSGLKSAVSAKVALSAAKRAATVDEFGGPLAEPMSFKQRVGFGLKQGLHLVGIGALLEMTLRPFLSLFPWPQYLGDTALRGFGRVALLTKFGPSEIVEGLAQSPLGFLGVSLPWAVTMEEITYRLLGFGITFLLIAGIKPLSRLISNMIEGLPDAAGVVGASKKVLRGAEWISHLAFPLAAGISSLNFAVAHFANWGFSPYVFALNFLVGLFLAHTAYKSRSLTSPIVAHLVFNLVTVGSILLAVVTSPMTGAAFSIIAGLIGVAALLHSWLTARKERMFLLKNKGLATLMVGIMGTSLLFTGLPNAPKADRSAVNAAITQVQGKTETAVAPAAGTVATTKADTAAVESRADMVARVKPSVVNVIIRMGKGMAIGSGFILTPNGIFVTNGHVVGDKKPGDFVNAKVPGVPGELRAKVLAVNHDKDLAIVQLQPRPDGKPWPVVKLASEAPREGDEVIAMGYPRGLPFTVSQGIVSGLDDRGTTYVRKMQTDAAINPGNSGGPLFNTKGEVVGVNTEIATQSGGSEGLGFSIQAPEVAHIMEQYAHTGNIATASLGIISNLSDPMAPEAGLEIEYVRRGSAAEKAGLKRGDLIIGVADQSIDEGGAQGAGHIAAVLSKIMPGQKVTVTVLRGDEPVEIEVTADAKATFAPSH